MIALVSSVALTVLLSACGGESGEVAAPSPTPAPAPVPIVPTDAQLCSQFAAVGQGYYTDVVRPLVVKGNGLTTVNTDTTSLLADLTSLQSLSPTGSANGVELVQFPSPMEQATANLAGQAYKAYQMYQQWIAQPSSTPVNTQALFDAYTNTLFACARTGAQPAWFDAQALAAEGHSGASGGTPQAQTAPVQTAAPVAASTGPATTVGNGTYLVGTDIAPGTYHSAGPDGSNGTSCYWARSKDASGSSIIANNISQGPSVVTVRSSDGTFESTGCQAWIKTK